MTVSANSYPLYAASLRAYSLQLSGTSPSKMRLARLFLHIPKPRKSPAATAGLLVLRPPQLVSRGRGELRDQTFERLEGLLGKIGVKSRDFLRLGHEGLISGLREFGLHFNRLVHRLHAGQLLDERLGVFKRFLGVIAIGAGDCLKTVLNGSCRRNDRLEVFFSVVLNVFNIDHWSPFADWDANALPLRALLPRPMRCRSIHN